MTVNESAIQLMLDIETVGTGPSAATLSIGLVRFTEADGVLPNEHYHWHIDLADSIRQGATVDGETVAWWLTQPEHARLGLRGLQARQDGHGGEPEEHVLKQFNWRLQSPDLVGAPIWANGIDFDLVILRSALARHKVAPGWAYWQQRDLRTLRRLLPQVSAPKRDEADKHNALRDAMHQAAHCAALLRALRAGCAPREQEAQV